MSAHPQVVSFFLAGPTAVGKSAVAIELAQRVGGEIISVDSMQVYRGLDIGTAKPSRTELEQVRHHLIDVVEMNQSFDAAAFVRLASLAVGVIRSRGRVPIFCGGTGLYFKAYLHGLGESPAADPALRAELERMPISELLLELEAGDPPTFERIDRKNQRRVVRAVEVMRLTGKPFSAQRAGWTREASTMPGAGRLIGLTRSPGRLQERIAQRVDEMFAHGLVAETRALMDRGLEQNQTAMQALGYRQVVEHLRGERTLDHTVELVKIRTRQFAKRQLTWFRRQMRLEWISLDGLSARSAGEQIASMVKFA